MTMKILLTGAESVLGQAFVRLFASGEISLEPAFKGPCELVPFPATRLDVSRRNDVHRIFSGIAPAVVINATELGGAGECEENPWKATLINRDGAEHQAHAADEQGATIVTFGTDLVFDGMLRRPYAEEAAPNPLNVYGETKLGGELRTMTHARRFLVLRTGWLFGPGAMDPVEDILRRTADRKVLFAAEYPLRQPTSVDDVARATIFLLGQGKTGMVNVANEGAATEIGFTRRVLEFSGLADSIRVDLPPPSMPRSLAMMPRYCVLSCEQLRRTGFPMQRWEKALEKRVRDEAS